LSLRAPGLAAGALRDWLLLKMPAKVATVNATRAAVLRAPWAGPYTVPSGGATFRIRRTADTSTLVTVTVPDATPITATALAALFNAAVGVTVATVDSAERLVLTSPTAPAADVPSVLVLEEASGNTMLGFSRGGARAQVSALIAPGFNDVMDGLPTGFDFVSRGAGTVVVIIGDRRFRPIDSNPRRNEVAVSLDVSVFRVEPISNVHRNREAIQAALACVHELVSTTDGRQLGRVGEVIHCVANAGAVSGKPFSFGKKDSPGPLFDAAAFVLDVKVFERPS